MTTPNSGGSLQYPSTLNVGDEYITFQSHEYRTNQTGQVGPPTGPAVRLYMPSNVPATSNTNGFEQKAFVGPLGNLVRAGFTEIGNAAQQGDDYKFTSAGASRFVERVQGGSDSMMQAGGALATQVGLNMAGGMMQTDANVILNMSDDPAIYNPNIELMYKGPGLRSFGFNFPMQPTSAEEAQSIAAIVRHFKERTAADARGAFLKVPDVWKVTYMKGSSAHPYHNEWKVAACTNVNVQTGSGVDAYASFIDGFPMNAVLNITFTEVDVVLRRDQQNSNSLFGM